MRSRSGDSGLRKTGEWRRHVGLEWWASATPLSGGGQHQRSRRLVVAGVGRRSQGRGRVAGGVGGEAQDRRWRPSGAGGWCGGDRGPNRHAWPKTDGWCGAVGAGEQCRRAGGWVSGGERVGGCGGGGGVQAGIRAGRWTTVGGGVRAGWNRI
jgi:hypothetical protein